MTLEYTAAIRKALLKWFLEEARDLPWRRTTDPYRVWLSEIMLQQTRVDQGLPYYERFLAALPTVHDLARAPEDQVMKLWEGLGYYTRARNLHKAAKTVVERHGGKLPENADSLQLLPGIGKYTAGAIASIAFGERAPVVDGNVKRVLARLFDIDRSIDESATEAELWSLAENLVPRKAPGDFNQAMMELGARICTPKKPDCAGCPVQRYCRAWAEGTVAKRPVRKVKKRVPHKEIVVAVIQQDGKYLLGKRPPEGMLGGLWEFPGGKLEKGESHEQALARECREELGVTVKVGGLVASVKHAYTHFKVTLNVYRCTMQRGTPKSRVHTELRWVAPGDFAHYAFPKGNHKFLKLLGEETLFD
ncbi:MAG: A/G-specific adenine glycosylase [Candidatus Hydrogenedentes bacterium]|nr:A/G-specific adenine glycosylase [Candidatus Hydrogenedentota bacterium]